MAGASTAVYLTRVPLQPGASNVDAPTASAFQFYEKTYTTGTTQEVIFCPDRGDVSVTASFSTSTGSIEATCSPPSVVTAGTAVWSTWTPGVVGATTTAILTGFVAMRANLATGSFIKISVAC
jgi:hypothetical protein